MHISTVTYIVAAVAATCSSATASFIAKDVYLAKIAPGLLDRISKYRASKASLTAAQLAVLELAERVVRDYDMASIKTLDDACNSAFGKDQCFRIFADESIDLRAPNYCKCNTESDWCDKPLSPGYVCKRGVAPCTITTSKLASNGYTVLVLLISDIYSWMWLVACLRVPWSL